MSDVGSKSVPRSPGRQILDRLLRRTSARVGLAWIGLLLLISIFSPLLASSHPLLVRSPGSLSSPFLAHLSMVDVALLSAFLVAAILFFLRLSMFRKTLVFVAAMLVILIASALFLKPPQLIVYEQYREAITTGNLEVLVNAPVPFSPKDYLRDNGDTGLLPPLTATSGTHWFGTEENGADVLARMIHASRVALGIGFVATGIALVLGVLIGGAMGYFSGIVDIIGMRLVEVFEAVPTLFLLLTFVAFFERSLYLMMVIIS